MRPISLLLLSKIDLLNLRRGMPIEFKVGDQEHVLQAERSTRAKSGSKEDGKAELDPVTRRSALRPGDKAFYCKRKRCGAGPFRNTAGRSMHERRVHGDLKRTRRRIGRPRGRRSNGA